MSRPLLALALLGATAMPALANETLTVAVTKLPATLEPSAKLGNSNVNARVTVNVLERLMRIDENGDIQPELATEWRRIDDRTLELDIRAGVTCHDGSPFDATDVAFSFGPARLAGEEAPGNATSAQFLGSLDSVEAVGTDKVIVKTKAADPVLERRLANWMAEVICQEPYEAAGDFETWGRQVVGTGPYKLAEFDSTSGITLASHDAYWGDAPAAQSIEFKIVPELSARVAGLSTGEFDIITEVSPDQIDAINTIDGASVKGGAVQNVRVIIYDLANPALSDVRVRRAMNLAIDRDLIAEALYNGETTVPEGMQHPSFGALYDTTFGKPAYDPEAARALLKEAGYDGEPIEYRFLQNYYTNEVATAEVLQEMWRGVGLNVELKVMENWGQILDKENRGLNNWSNTVYFSDPSGHLARLYGPAGVPQRLGFWTEGTEAFNEQADILNSSNDPETRRQAFHKLLRMYRDEVVPGTVLHMLTQHYGVRDAVNWTPGSTSEMNLRAGHLALN